MCIPKISEFTKKKKFPSLFEGMFWNAGDFGYVIVLITLDLKVKYGWHVTVSTKKVIKVGKSKKHTFSFKADFSTFLV